jgi:hypothetical protein
MLGVKPAVGRLIRADEDKPGGDRVVLLSDGLVAAPVGRDPTIVGRRHAQRDRVHRDRRHATGVCPEQSELWIRFASSMVNTGATRNLFTFARLAPGVTIDQARTSLKQVAVRLSAAYRENADWSAKVTPLRETFIPSDIRLITLTMMGAVTFVLLIACANVANLMLARATARSREIAIRSALAPGSIGSRQLLTESVMVAVAGGVLGIPLAAWGLKLLDSRFRHRTPCRITSTGGRPADADLHDHLRWSRVFSSVSRGCRRRGQPAGSAARRRTRQRFRVRRIGCAARSSSPRSRCRSCCWWARRRSCAASSHCRTRAPV